MLLPAAGLGIRHKGCEPVPGVITEVCGMGMAVYRAALPVQSVALIHLCLSGRFGGRGSIVSWEEHTEN